MEIYPSILVEDYQEFEKRVKLIEPASSLLHIDVGDGVFVPHKSFQDIEKIKHFPFTKPFELHLMIECAEMSLTPWLLVPAKRIVLHYEAAHSNQDALKEAITLIKSAGKEVGVAINPATPAQVLAPFFDDLASIIVMGVVPGFSGQQFMPEVLPKLAFLHENFHGIIEVDGGMNKTTIAQVKEKGAEAVAVASAIFDAPDPGAALTELNATFGG